MDYIYILILVVLIAAYFVYRRIRLAISPVVSHLSNFEVLEVQISKIDQEGAGKPQLASLSAENMFSALHGLLREEGEQEHFSFEVLASTETGIRFFAVVPTKVAKFVESQIYAQHPSAQIKVVSDYLPHLDITDKKYSLTTLRFTKKEFFPIKSFRDMEVDPLSALTSALSNVTSTDQVVFQIVAKPTADNWQAGGHAYTEALRSGKDVDAKAATVTGILGTFASMLGREFIGILARIITGIFTFSEGAGPVGGAAEAAPAVKLSAPQQLEILAIDNKLSRMGFEVVIRVLSIAETAERVEENMRHFLAAFQQYSTINLNSFISVREIDTVGELNQLSNRAFDTNKTMILNIEELATICHYPSSAIDTPNISWVLSRKGEPPANLPINDCVYIGNTVYRSQPIKFGIKKGDDRLRHMYLIGKSGVGKSTLFETMLIQDIHNGEGVGLLDPHGETIEKVLERIPDNRIEDVIYIDPSDVDNPVGINLLQIDEPSQKNLLASGLLSAIRQHFDYSWGPRLEYLLNYAILTLLDVPGTTMLGITRLLEDTNYQKYILHHVSDPAVMRFWEKEYKEFKGNQKLVTEAIAPIQNKVNRFLASSTIRNILGQKTSTIDLWDAINSKKIILMNLSIGKVGQDNANLLGALLVSRIQFYALQRARIPEKDRVPFYLYVDEFQNFATGSFEQILSESRKYKLGLYLTHQFTAQLPEELLKAVYGNVGTIATFSVGAPDAHAMSLEFAPYFDAEDIISLERFQIYIKLMVDGMTSLPFSAEIIRPWEDDFPIKPTGNKQKVLERSRQKYGTDRKYVEEKIAKWFVTQFDKGLAIAQEKKEEVKEENK